MTCPNYQTPVGAPNWKARQTYLWANQFGECVRIFCNECGGWYDVTTLGERVKVREIRRGRDDG